MYISLFLFFGFLSAFSGFFNLGGMNNFLRYRSLFFGAIFRFFLSCTYRTQIFNGVRDVEE